MKDVKSYVIGFLTCACLFLVMGQTKSDNFGDIDVNSVSIIGKDGRLMGKFGEDGLWISDGHIPRLLLNKMGTFLLNEKGDDVINLMQNDGDGGSIHIFNKHKKIVVTLQGNKNEDGLIMLYDRYGETGWGMSGKQ